MCFLNPHLKKNGMWYTRHEIMQCLSKIPRWYCLSSIRKWITHSNETNTVSLRFTSFCLGSRIVNRILMTKWQSYILCDIDTCCHSEDCTFTYSAYLVSKGTLSMREPSHHGDNTSRVLWGTCVGRDWTQGSSQVPEYSSVCSEDKQWSTPTSTQATVPSNVQVLRGKQGVSSIPQVNPVPRQPLLCWLLLLWRICEPTPGIVSPVHILHPSSRGDFSSRVYDDEGVPRSCDRGA